MLKWKSSIEQQIQDWSFGKMVEREKPRTEKNIDKIFWSKNIKHIASLLRCPIYFTNHEKRCSFKCIYKEFVEAKFMKNEKLKNLLTKYFRYVLRGLYTTSKNSVYICIHKSHRNYGRKYRTESESFQRWRFTCGEVSWFDCVIFANMLSEEGWKSVPHSKGTDVGFITDQLAKSRSEHKANGYRLPTEA